MNQEYINAVATSDIVKIRSYITSAIMADPAFTTKKAIQYVEYAIKNGVALIEPYAKTPCETIVPENEEQWDQRLFYDKIEDLRLNFAYKERIGEIQKIGKKVFGERDSFTEAPEDHRSESKNKVVPLAVGIALLVVLALTLYLLLK